MRSQLRVMVVGGKLFGELMAVALAQSQGISVLGPHVRAEPVDRLVESQRPDVVIVETSGLDSQALRSFIASVHSAHPGTAVVSLVDSEDDEALFTSLDSGVAGVIHKGQSLKSLTDSVEAASERNITLCPSLAKKMLERLHAVSAQAVARPEEDRLSAREIAVLCGVARGMTNEQIARQAGVSPSTVKNQLHSACRKLGVSSRGHAVAEGIRRNIISAAGEPVGVN